MLLFDECVELISSSKAASLFMSDKNLSMNPNPLVIASDNAYGLLSRGGPDVIRLGSEPPAILMIFSKCVCICFILLSSSRSKASSFSSLATLKKSVGAGESGCVSSCDSGWVSSCDSGWVDASSS